MEHLEVKVSKNVIKMFYAYLKIKLHGVDQNEGDIQAVYTFMSKFIFRELYDVDCFREYDIDELKNLFAKYYKVFAKDATDDDMLGKQLREITNSRKVDYSSISDLKNMIIRHIHDYIDFLDQYYVSDVTHSYDYCTF